MNRIISFLFLFFCFFPFIGINIGTDVQPFALLFAFLVILIAPKKNFYCKTSFIFFALVVLILTIISISTIPIFSVIKRVFSYVSLIIILQAGYILFQNNGMEKYEKTIKVFILIWTFVGAVQYLFNKNFLTFLIPLSRTSPTRGVCSLASEPSFYGYMCFFFFLISLLFKKEKMVYITLSIIQTVVFAQSAVSILYFIVFFVAYLLFSLTKLSFKKMIIIICVSGLAIFALRYALMMETNNRFILIIQKIVFNPKDFFTSDSSAISRYNSIVASFSRYGLPSFIGERLFHSGFGSLFYELGIFSLFAFIPIWKALLNSSKDKVLKATVLVAVTISMLSGIQLSLPLAAMYFGLNASLMPIESLGERKIEDVMAKQQSQINIENTTISSENI